MRAREQMFKWKLLLNQHMHIERCYLTSTVAVQAWKCVYLHVQETKALAVQQQCEDNEGEGNVGPQDPQRGYADKIPEKRFFAH